MEVKLLHDVAIMAPQCLVHFAFCPRTMQSVFKKPPTLASIANYLLTNEAFFASPNVSMIVFNVVFMELLCHCGLTGIC